MIHEIMAEICRRRCDIFIWKRKIGDKLVVGDDIVVVVNAVTPAGGGVFKGTVTLGFEVPKNVLVQRAEKYVKQKEPPPFPVFYRIVDKETGRIFGYSFDTAAEGSTLTYGYNHELISDYLDMTGDDHRVSIYMFRTEAEAEACVIGVAATDASGETIGAVKSRADALWYVLLDHYEDPPQGPNPAIRSFVVLSDRVDAAIKSGPRRKAG
jgi:sRNA-binding carbon storage regulator CsrA